ncbi:hypothetical protein Nepgr_010492 [Nepenthes gracilis]|uniref:Uncharacterized protein n=1 Tax=Nepenthes gracilis TaxID=150966 RepID=A0AAD3XL49_NEPGR|nr:hypothetical protein Nepgr_010492 [Nepenthes gracilis]
MVVTHPRKQGRSLLFPSSRMWEKPREESKDQKQEEGHKVEATRGGGLPPGQSAVPAAPPPSPPHGPSLNVILQTLVRNTADISTDTTGMLQKAYIKMMKAMQSTISHPPLYLFFFFEGISFWVVPNLGNNISLASECA